jgi:CO/xanthine dehydrogenase Mo-binding subunit
MNEKTAQGQQMGGIVFGIGMALLEKRRDGCALRAHRQ